MLFRVKQKSAGFSLLEVVVSLAIIGVAVVAVMQLFSISLRTTKKSTDYTVAVAHAKSIMQSVYAKGQLSPGEDMITLGEDFKARVLITPKAKEDSVATYNIEVVITWPPAGSFALMGMRTIHELDE